MFNSRSYTACSSYPGIKVGFEQTSYNTPETGGPLSVCVEMFNRNITRNVSLTITSSDGTAIGITYRLIYRMHNFYIIL